MSFLIDVVNGVQKLVSATASAVGAEPALSDPGPGTWYLRSIGAIRSWVASIPWASVDKTGAVATDVGALPEIVVTGSVNFNSINSGLPCSAEISPSSVSNGPTGYTSPTRSHLLQSRGAANYLTQVLTTATAAAFRGMTSPGVWGAWRYAWDDAYLPISAFAMTLLDDASATAARSTLGVLPIANPTATGTLTTPDVVVSNLAGATDRSVAIDTAGKLTAQPTIALDAGASTTGTGEQLLLTGSYAPSKSEVVIRGYTGGAAGTYTIRVKDNGNLLIQESFVVSSTSIQFVIRFSTSSVASDCLYDMISGPNGGPFSSKAANPAIGAVPTGALTITGESSTALDGIILRQVITSQGG